MNDMRHSSSQTLSRRVLARGAVLFFLLTAVPAAVLRAETAGEQTEAELLTLFDQVVASVLAGDDAGLDAATCLGDMIHATLAREEALGLVPDARDPNLLAERQADARAAVYAFVERLLETGQAIERTDVSRVELFVAPDESGETLRGEGEEELEITASGVFGIQMLSSQRMVDIDVVRLRDRWCIDPLSMQ